MFFDYAINLTNFDIVVVMIISLLTSIIVVLMYAIIKNRKCIYLDLANTNNIFYTKGKNGYLEKLKKIDEKTTYVESSFILSISNSTNKPYTFRNICVVNKKGRNRRLLEEGSLNISGTGKSVAGVTSYDKLKHLVVKPYESMDYDVNIRMSKDEYLKYKKIYLSYKGVKNKIYYVRLKVKRPKSNKKIMKKY